mgnify:CR=1 FL=1
MTLRKKVIATDYEAWNDPKFGFWASWGTYTVSVLIYGLLLNPDFSPLLVSFFQLVLLCLIGISIFAVIDERRGTPE